MRTQFRASQLQNVCVFCAIRSQFAPARPAIRTQRRLFRSSAGLRKPPAAAAAAAAATDQSREGYSPSYQYASEPTPKPSGHWGGDRSYSSPQRRDIQKIHRIKLRADTNTTLSEERLQPRRFSRETSTPVDVAAAKRTVGEWRCNACATLNPQVRNNCRRCNRAPQKFLIQWSCPSCGWHNFRGPSRCQKCNSFNPDEAHMEHNTRHRDRIRRVPDPPENRHGKGPGVSRLRSSTPRESRFYRDLDRRETSTTGKLNEAQPSYAIDDPPAYSTPAEEQKAVNYGGASNTTAPSAGFGTGWGSLNRSEVNSREGEKNQREAAVVTSPEHIAEPPQSTADNSSANDSSWPDNVSSTESSSKLPKRSMFSYPYESQAGVQERSGDLPHEDISWLEATTPKTSPRPDLSDRKQRASAADTPMTHPTDTSSYVPGSASLDKPSDDGRLQPDRSTHTFERPPMHRSTRTSQSRSSPVRDSIDRPISHDTRSRRRRRFGGESSDVELTPSARRSRIDASTYAGGRGPRKMQQVQEDYEDDFEEDREESRARRKEQRKKEKAALKRKLPPTPIHLPEFISVGNLAQVLKVRVEDFSKKMHALGFEETNNDHLLDAEVAGLIAAEFNFEAIVDTAAEDQDLQARPPAQDKAVLPQRPPIVTIMGHVDHGKTTLLDYLRKSSVAASEHGGITQHIGAFSVSMPGGRSGTFLDTPGHAAFLSMRQRGANVTDIVILVVAADDSVKPQTVEAIKHAQAAKVPMIVAINKVDKEDKNIERVKSDLARYGVEIEDFGGDTQVVCVSGKTGQGLDELEDATVALADIIDMRAEADGQSEGWVLEATTKKAGRVATVLVKRGTMRRGDIVVAGSTWAKIRTLKNEAGVQVPYAGPGIPVEVDGWKDQPTAGDEVLQAESEQQAKSAVSFRLKRIEKEQMAADMSAVNESRRLEQEKREAEKREAAIAETAKTNGLKTPSTADTSSKITADANTTTPPSGPAPSPTGPLTLPILLKADVSGSLEACANAITALSSPLITPHILRSSVGPVSPSDIALADSSSAQIISFNQTTSAEIYSHANRLGVKLVEENIIYRLSESVRAELEKMLPPRIERRVLGEAEVGMRFEVGIGGRKKAWVAGCKVRNGVIAKKDKIKVVRGKLGEGEVVVFEGFPTSLKNIKKDVPEMRKGTECGMAFDNWEGFAVGDQVQSFEEKEIAQTL